MKYNFHIVKLIDHLNLIVAKQDYHTGGKWIVHDTKHPQGKSVAIPETPLQVIPM